VVQIRHKEKIILHQIILLTIWPTEEREERKEKLFYSKSFCQKISVFSGVAQGQKPAHSAGSTFTKKKLSCP
jgi:hypothetical protein